MFPGGSYLPHNTLLVFYPLDAFAETGVQCYPLVRHGGGLLLFEELGDSHGFPFIYAAGITRYPKKGLRNDDGNRVQRVKILDYIWACRHVTHFATPQDIWSSYQLAIFTKQYGCNSRGSPNRVTA